MSLTDLCKKLEHFETPRWAADAILKKEILTQQVFDPCAGSGILCEAAKSAGYTPYPMDIHDWGYARTHVQDFLLLDKINAFDHGFSVLMNPPFSLACAFVGHAKNLGARKILCFQRFAWWESRARKDFWDRHPPSRVYICGDRAPCWRHDIPAENRTSSTPTAHAVFVFEDGHNGGTILDRLYKS